MKITNWDKWQTYRSDRSTPPWIKIYRNLMSNHEWVQLTDAEKGQLVSIWILAADKKGAIPDCPRTIQKMCMLDKQPNISKFKELGFMTPTCQPDGCQDDATVTHQTRLEETRLEKTREEKPLSSKLDESARTIINQLNLKTGKQFQSVDSNLKLIKQRLKEGHSIDDLFWVIDEKVNQWNSDKKMRDYLRPSTLFNAEKFNQYIGERGVVHKKDDKERFNDWIDSNDDSEFSDNENIIEGDYSVVN